MIDFSEIKAPSKTMGMLTSAHVQSGPPIDPLKRVLIYEPAEWENFIDEWAFHCLKLRFSNVLRFSGANDRGIDIAGFADDRHLLGVWENFQCKHYDHSIMPSEAWPEIGKILWHSFNRHFVPPRAYYFVAPRGTGTTLTNYLSNTPVLKNTLISAWPKSVADKITSTETIQLEGEFANYVNSFDFSIFKPLSVREVIEHHRRSPCFIERFGGGLPPRPRPENAPEEIHANESGYITKLLAAYGDHKKQVVPDIDAIKQWQPLTEHFHRQRECFYHAESLRIFVRDKVEPGTFEGLQEEIYQGVIDVCDSPHLDGFERVKAVTHRAHGIALDAHPLGPSASVKDRSGICHQLANEDRLKWTT